MKCSSPKYQCSIVKAVVNMAARPFVLLRQNKAMNWIGLHGRVSYSLNQQKTIGVNTSLQVINLILVLRFAQKVLLLCPCIIEVLGSCSTEKNTLRCDKIIQG